MRKLFFAFFLSLLFAFPCLAADCSVTRCVTDCTVLESGDCRITQKLELALTAPVSELRLPIARHAVKVSVIGVDAKIEDCDGSFFAAVTPPKNAPETLTLEITYTTRGHVTETESGQLFSAPLADGLWEIPIERYSFTVVYPKAPETAPVYLAGGQDISERLTLHTDGRIHSAVLRGGLRSREDFTVTLDAPIGFFTVTPAETPASPAVRWLLPLLEGCLIAFCIYYWFRFLRFGGLHIRARTLPPDDMTPAELPFILAGEKISLGLLACHWASLGYLTIHETTAGRIILCRAEDMEETRREEEQKLFEYLFRASPQCEADSMRFRRTAELCDRTLRRYWARRLYDRGSGSPALLRIAASVACGVAMLYTMEVFLTTAAYKGILLAVAFIAGCACGASLTGAYLRWLLHDTFRVALAVAAGLFLLVMGAIGGGLLCIIPAIALAAAVSLASLGGGRLTETGRTVVEQALGFRRFLYHVEGQHLAQMVRNDPRLFYKMLLYAQSVGIAVPYGRQLPGRVPEPCFWLRTPGKQFSRGYEHAALFERILRKMDRV